eukprot:6270520-Prymnesium_polylepis.1
MGRWPYTDRDEHERGHERGREEPNLERGAPLRAARSAAIVFVYIQAKRFFSPGKIHSISGLNPPACAVESRVEWSGFTRPNACRCGELYMRLSMWRAYVRVSGVRGWAND